MEQDENDQWEESVSVRIIGRIAAAEAVEPYDLTPPLYEVIDPEALDALFRSSHHRDDNTPAVVEFQYLGYTIVVDSNRNVDVARVQSPPDSTQNNERQQEIITALEQQALESDDFDELLHEASVAVADTLETEYAKVLELRPGGEEVLLRQGVGWRPGLVGTATVPTDLRSQAGYTLLSEAPIIVEELGAETRFSGPELLTSHDIVSGISVIIGSVKNPWGVLGTHTVNSRQFTEDDAMFVQDVANILAEATK